MSFRETLHAGGPAPDRAAQMMLYGQFVGSWDGKVVVHEAGGGRRENTCEVHFGWALQGRAVQDVWIVPSRQGRGPGTPDLMYGTTIRVYDPKSDSWGITWIDPVRRAFNRMDGRKIGDDIVQEYRDAQGLRCQWVFTGIKADSFHWAARESADDGASWKLTGEFFLQRRAEPPGDFDFWIGDWVVTDPTSGETLGEDRVERILGGSALREQWTGANGVRGESLNTRNAARKAWHQSWVDSAGTVLLLDGGLRDGAMELQGRDLAGVLQRIRWTPQPDRSVLQHWECSKDGGKSWETAFKGLYRRKA